MDSSIGMKPVGIPAGADYERARHLMAADVNAAIMGAFDAGASEVLVTDAHGSSRNIMVEELDVRARLISGSTTPLSMMEGVAGADIAMFVGYHSRAHSRGVMNHTYTGSLLEYRINGRALGEFGMNALLAAHYGVPAVMVTGDSEATAEARSMVPGIVTVTVKEPVGQLAANLIHPVRARELIRAGALAATSAALRGQSQPALGLEGPVDLELRFARSVQADAAAVLPGAERTAANAVSWRGRDYLDCFRAFRAMIALATWS